MMISGPATATTNDVRLRNTENVRVVDTRPVAGRSSARYSIVSFFLEP